MQNLNNVPTEISVSDAKELLDSENPPFLLDVRENDEVAICKIEGSVHIPMGQVAEKLGELPRNEKLLVYCHHGGRSHKVMQLLLDQGLMAINIQGGIDAWARVIDSQLARY